METQWPPAPNYGQRDMKLGNFLLKFDGDILRCGPPAVAPQIWDAATVTSGVLLVPLLYIGIPAIVMNAAPSHLAARIFMGITGVFTLIVVVGRIVEKASLREPLHRPAQFV